MMDENILKLFYQIGEKGNDFSKKRTVDDLLSFRKMHPAQLKSGLNRLNRQNLLVNDSSNWQLTESGLEKAKR